MSATETPRSRLPLSHSVSPAAALVLAIVSSFSPPSFQDFRGFWDSKFGAKKEPEQNGEAANGSVKKRTPDLAIYEQFEQQVCLCPCISMLPPPLWRSNACVHAGVLGLSCSLDPRSGFYCFRPDSRRCAPRRFAMGVLM